MGLDVGAIGSISLVSFGSGGRNSFEHPNKFLIFEINNELWLPGWGFFNFPTIGNTCSLPAIDMTLRYIIIFVFGLFFFTANAQTGIDTLFVGNVTGMSATRFAKQKFNLTKTFKLVELPDSKNKIEVRLYETYFLAGLTYCTILSFDTSFKVSRLSHYRFYDSTKYQPKQTNSLSDKNLAGIFNRLIAAGIFSLPNKSFRDIFKGYNAKELTTKGLREAGIMLVADGIGYALEYKVDNIFNRIKFDNPEAYSKAYPDNQIFSRQRDIVTALGAGFE